MTEKQGDQVGAYLCNHLFYYARHWIETHRLDLPLGFIHVPPFPEQVEGLAGRQGMDLQTLRKAAEVCMEVMASAPLNAERASAGRHR